MMYLGLKLLHVIAVALFLGNITTGIFWKAHGDRTKDPHSIAVIIEGIIRSDQWFTIPGVVAIILTGVGTAMIGGLSIFGTPWILWSLILFGISGVAFMAQVAPLQRKMLALARSAGDSGNFDWPLYHKLSRRWELWGVIALLTPFAAMALMVFKAVPR
jgi:uncharacterized membrane protein